MTRLCVLLMLLATAGCAAVKGADAPVTIRLSPPPPAGEAALAKESLTVLPVQARGITSGLRYTYVDAAAPAVLRQAATLFWEEPPTRILERALVAGLRTRFVSVAGPDIATTADRRVVATLDRFEEANAGADARAIVMFDVTLSGRSLVSGRYCAAVPIRGPAPSLRAAAFDAAIAQAVGTFVQDAATGRLAMGAC